MATTKPQDAAAQIFADAKKYGLEWWGEPHAPWDQLWLGADLMPGIWEVKSGELVRQIDKKKSKDEDGANVRDLGLNVAKFSALGRMVAREDWVELQRILPALEVRRKGGVKSPVSIYHPAVALLGIATIYVNRLTVPTVDAKGIMEINIDMVEWTPPKPTKVVETPRHEETEEEWNARAEADLDLQRRFTSFDFIEVPDKVNSNPKWREMATGKEIPSTAAPSASDQIKLGPPPGYH